MYPVLHALRSSTDLMGWFERKAEAFTLVLSRDRLAAESRQLHADDRVSRLVGIRRETRRLVRNQYTDDARSPKEDMSAFCLQPNPS